MAMRDFEISKRLKNSDVRSKIWLPIRITKHMIQIMNGSHFLDLKVVDSRSQKWNLRFYTRPNGRGRGPVFTAGWPRLVKPKVFGSAMSSASMVIKSELVMDN
ncbi:hypothetical protein Ddye_026093 [Dipteronia dyeriana]|uniref:TF-B3 domain-containing protein n=1 Tax=Dipteronia dyeriana TaxID=168575 RepID=A0AAD9WQ59_9ROSI|nr:hypothetical protein Ddye_026093 [Dipteronia dyeriana]